MNWSNSRADSRDECRESWFRVTRHSSLIARDGSVMWLIPAGEFIMGLTPEQIEAARLMDIGGHEFSPLDELPQFSAFLQDFYLGECTVTNGQFAKFLNAMCPPPEQLKLWVPSLEQIGIPPDKSDIYRVVPGLEKHAVVHVSWFGADAYCRWAGLRLPTELEWEKAARGTDGRLYPWGNEWHSDFRRWHNTAKPGLTTAPVDARPEGRSPFGIFQMAGNVDEWCADPYLAVMLTIKAQYSLQNAESYFRKHLRVGDYYMGGRSVSGQWFGEGARQLGLCGVTNEAGFVNLCRNLHPQSGEQLTLLLNFKRIYRISY